MNFQLIIDNENEELITARVKKANELTDRIENLVKEYVGENKIVEIILSFLVYKK